LSSWEDVKKMNGLARDPNGWNGPGGRRSVFDENAWRRIDAVGSYDVPPYVVTVLEGDHTGLGQGDFGRLEDFGGHGAVVESDADVILGVAEFTFDVCHFEKIYIASLLRRSTRA
jgi:hypothetical protein